VSRIIQTKCVLFPVKKDLCGVAVPAKQGFIGEEKLYLLQEEVLGHAPTTPSEGKKYPEDPPLYDA
jgi:hypothetical protein